MNFFEMRVKGNEMFNDDGLSIKITEGHSKILQKKGYDGKKVIFGIRSEDISSRVVAQETYPDSTIEAEVIMAELLGNETILYAKYGESEFASRVNTLDNYEPGDKVKLTFNVAKGHFFDVKSEETII